MTKKELYKALKQEGSSKMFLVDLIEKNGHKLTHRTNIKDGRNYESVFNYSDRHGGTFDSFKYYNNYYVDVT